MSSTSQESAAPTVSSAFSDLNGFGSQVANFFVVYGLAFQLLTEAIGESASTYRAEVAMRAIQCLVHDEMSGTDLFASSVFDELCTLCYRIALLSSASVKTAMFDIMSAFASSRGEQCDQEQARRCLAVIAFALKSSIGSREVPSNCEFANDNQRHGISRPDTCCASCLLSKQSIEKTRLLIGLYSSWLASVRIRASLPVCQGTNDLVCLWLRYNYTPVSTLEHIFNGDMDAKADSFSRS